MENRFKKLVNHIQLLKEYNDLRIRYNELDHNFKNSAYKHILKFENQDRENKDLENKVLDLKEELSSIKKDSKKVQAIQSLRERKNKNV